MNRFSLKYGRLYYNNNDNNNYYYYSMPPRATRRCHIKSDVISASSCHSPVPHQGLRLYLVITVICIEWDSTPPLIIIPSRLWKMIPWSQMTYMQLSFYKNNRLTHIISRNEKSVLCMFVCNMTHMHESWVGSNCCRCCNNTPTFILLILIIITHMHMKLYSPLFTVS